MSSRLCTHEHVDEHYAYRDVVKSRAQIKGQDEEEGSSEVLLAVCSAAMQVDETTRSYTNDPRLPLGDSCFEPMALHALSDEPLE